MSESPINKEILFNRIADMVSKAANIPVEKITSESTFQILGLDSLDALAMINDLEEEFNVRISNQEVLKITTVGQAVESFQKLLT